MSIQLPNINLAALAVGQQGTIDLTNVGISAGGVSANPSLTQKKATLFFFNESGTGLNINFKQSGSGFSLPAGAWITAELNLGETAITYTVVYLLPNPPVSLLLLTYYAPNEPIPASAILGNSPIGIGGTVTTSSVQTLSNEGNPVNTLVIDIGTVTVAQLLQIFTDHFLWQVQQAGVAHQVLKGQTAGNPLQIGQAGDVTEVLGKLTVDQLLTTSLGISVSASGISVTGGVSSDSGSFSTTLSVTSTATVGALSTTGAVTGGALTISGISSLDNGALTTDGSGRIILSNNVPLQIKNSGGSAKDTLYMDAADETVLQAPVVGKPVIMKDGNGASIAKFDTGGMTLVIGTVKFLTGSIAHVDKRGGVAFTAGTTTYTHTLSYTPDFCVIEATTANSSATTGWNSPTSTTIKITVGATLNYDLLFFKF